MGREQLGPYTLSWPEGVFPLGGDALALGEFATVRPRWRVCDLGTGSGALLLLLARRAEGLSLTGVERDPLAARTARDNLAANGLPGELVLGDWREAPLPAGVFDLVVSNPPYFPPGSGRGNDPARMELHGGLDELCAAAGRLLKNGGRFALCHRRSGCATPSAPCGTTAWSPNACGWYSSARESPPFSFCCRRFAAAGRA